MGRDLCMQECMGSPFRILYPWLNTEFHAGLVSHIPGDDIISVAIAGILTVSKQTYTFLTVDARTLSYHSNFNTSQFK